MIKHKIYKEPTDDQKKELYKFYEIIFDSDFTLSKKRSLITAVLSSFSISDEVFSTFAYFVIGLMNDNDL